MGGLDRLEDLPEPSALRVAPVVVGHDRLDPVDAVVGEGVDGPLEEPSARVSLLIAEDLGVREPGVVIDHGVDVVEPDPGSLLRRGRAHLASVGPPATPVGDPPDLLDVHVDQLTGPSTFVAHRGGL